jgi:hypothetical protein
MIDTKSETPVFTMGERVTGMVLRYETASASFVLQLPGNVPAVISAYEVTDDEFGLLAPGSMFTAVVDRVEHSGKHVSIVLRKRMQPVAV